MSEKNGFQIGEKSFDEEWKAKAHVKDLVDSGTWASTEGWTRCHADIKRRGDKFSVRLILSQSKFREFAEFLGRENALVMMPMQIQYTPEDCYEKMFMALYDINGLHLLTPLDDETFERMRKRMNKVKEA